MAESLDEYSTYFPPGRSKAFERRMDGFGHGLGIRAKHRPGRPPVVTAVLYDSPADRANVNVGQQIIRIGEHPAAELDPRRLREVLAPPLGQSAVLVLRGPAGPGDLSVTLTSAASRTPPWSMPASCEGGARTRSRSSPQVRGTAFR